MIEYFSYDSLREELLASAGESNGWLANSIALAYVQYYGDHAALGAPDDGLSGLVRATDAVIAVTSALLSHLCCDMSDCIEQIGGGQQVATDAVGRGIVNAINTMMERPLPHGCLCTLAFACERTPLGKGFTGLELKEWGLLDPEDAVLDTPGWERRRYRWFEARDFWGRVGENEVEELRREGYLVTAKEPSVGEGQLWYPSAWPVACSRVKWVASVVRREDL